MLLKDLVLIKMQLVFFSITAEIVVKYFAQIAPPKGPQCLTSKILNEFVMVVMVSLLHTSVPMVKYF